MRQFVCIKIHWNSVGALIPLLVLWSHLLFACVWKCEKNAINNKSIPTRRHKVIQRDLCDSAKLPTSARKKPNYIIHAFFSPKSSFLSPQKNISTVTKASVQLPKYPWLRTYLSMTLNPLSLDPWPTNS